MKHQCMQLGEATHGASRKCFVPHQEAMILSTGYDSEDIVPQSQDWIMLRRLWWPDLWLGRGLQLRPRRSCVLTNRTGRGVGCGNRETATKCADCRDRITLLR